MPRQRPNNRRADCIFTADIHLRDDTPECRTDDFAAARQRKIEWLRGLQAENGGCPIIDGGDLCHKWQVSSELEGWALINMPDGMITVPGQHDLPNHSLALYKKSSLHVLEAAGKVKVLIDSEKIKGHTHIGEHLVTGFAYGTTLLSDRKNTGNANSRTVAVVHAFVGETVPPFINGYTSAQILAALPGYDVIVAGDHHVPLVHVARNGRLVVVPGSMMRTTADQADFRPRVYLWYADTNTVEPAYYPIETGVVSREHLDRAEERETRMTAFVNRLDGDGVEVGLSFADNIEKYMVENGVRNAVRARVREAVSGK